MQGRDEGDPPLRQAPALFPAAAQPWLLRRSSKEPSLIAAVVWLGILLPPGALAVRLARVDAPALARLVMAVGLGFSAVLPLLLLQRHAGGLWLPPLLAVSAISALRPGPRHWSDLRAVAPEIALSALLAALAVLVNAGDMIFGADGGSARYGFDVSDRAFYALVAQEVERAPLWRVENPVFAGFPLQYSYMPSLAAVFLHRYACVPVLSAWNVYLPALGLGFTGLAGAAFAQSLGARTLASRSLAAVLVALGGDLSFVVPHINDILPDRARHFFVFYSFSSEVQFYNPWTFGVPLGMTAVLWTGNYCRSGSRIALLATSVVAAALFETKPFAFIVFWLALAAVGLVLRHRRALAVAGLSLVAVSPAIVLTLAVGDGGRGGAALLPAWFAFVYDAVAANPSLAAIAAHAGFPLAALVVLAGNFGLRLLGLRALWSAAAPGQLLEARLAAAAILVGTALALLSRGQPTRLDGTQFLVLAQVLLWPFAALAIHGMFCRSMPYRLAAIALVAAAVSTPLRYVCYKRFPEQLTPAGSLDRLRYRLSPTTMAACQWLRTHTGALDRLVLPLAGDPENIGGLKPLYVAAIAERRIVAQEVAYHEEFAKAQERLDTVERLYSTTDAIEAEQLLSRLGVSWVWVDAARPLRFESRHLEPRATFGNTLLLHFAPP